MAHSEKANIYAAGREVCSKHLVTDEIYNRVTGRSVIWVCAAIGDANDAERGCILHRNRLGETRVLWVAGPLL